MVKPKGQMFPVLLDHMQIPNSGSAITAEPIPNLSKSSEIQTDFICAFTTQYKCHTYKKLNSGYYHKNTQNK